jgi:hypothetical protein
MANTREELVNRFIAFNGAGKIQSAVGTAQPNADIDTRDKCTITREEIIVRRDVRDCRNEDLVSSDILTRLARYTLVFAEVTPQILARFFALCFGAAAAPTGSPANEVQTITVTGDGTLSLTLEGRTVTTKTIPAAATAAQIQAALTAARMRFIHPGDVVITGTGPFTATFGGRLAHANLATMVGTGGFAVAASANGAQKFHAFSRATSRTKVPFSFALGYEDNTATIEKYADYVCESFQPSANLDGDPALTVTLLGPWDYDSLEPTLTIPDCVNPTPLRTEDCTVEINSVFETADVNTVTNNLNDNVPVDRLSAFSYDGIDVQRLLRGKQPTYTAAASIFGLAGAGSDTAPAVLAQNERSQAAVPVIEHFGLPGNRFSLIYPNAKVRFQPNRETYVGAAEFTAVNLDIVPTKDGNNPPVKAEAYVDQTTAFLVASS